MKVGLMDLSTHGGKIKFEFLAMKIPAKCTQVHKADFLKIIRLYLKDPIQIPQEIHWVNFYYASKP